jgi:hypothetical protein
MTDRSRDIHRTSEHAGQRLPNHNTSKREWNMEQHISEPRITCPHCKTEIKLTESLAAPLIAETRKNFEQQLARKEAEFGKREASLRQSQQELARAREAIDEEVTKRPGTERSGTARPSARRVAAAPD